MTSPLPRPFLPFEMERWQSTWEHRVEINLSESGVHPLSTRELLDLGRDEAPDETRALSEALLDLRHEYGQSNGSDRLRARIAALYPEGDPDGVLVTQGGAEANLVSLWRLLEHRGDWAALLPTYMQVPGLVRNFGGTLHPVPLRESQGWQPDPDDVEAAFRGGAGVLLVTNPNNPTGAVIEEDRLEAILASAAHHGAWIVADEVYSGAELDGTPTPTLFHRHPRVICTHSLSKAYGLPGLRIGWAITSPAMAEELWARTDYTSIAPATLSDALATLALEPRVRSKVLARTRGILNANRDLFAAWVDSLEGLVRFHPPEAGAIALVSYGASTPSLEIAERLRSEHEVLVVPGTHFGLEGTLRLGFGNPADELAEGLGRVGDLLGSLPPRTSTPDHNRSDGVTS